MDRLTEDLGGPEIWIKRDDCTGVNRRQQDTQARIPDGRGRGTRRRHGDDPGATQSNHARQTAAFAAKLGFECHILLEDRTGYNDDNYNANGNVLLDQLHGATTENLPGGTDMNAEMESAADRSRADGRKVLYHPRRRLEPNRRARLRQLRLRTDRPGQ